MVGDIMRDVSEGFDVSKQVEEIETIRWSE